MPSNNKGNKNRSGDPRKRSEARSGPSEELYREDSRYAPTSWGSNEAGGGFPLDLEVPSGQICLVRRPGVEGLLKAGVLNKLDTLTQIVDEEHLQRVHGKGKPGIASAQAAGQKLLEDPRKIEEILHTVDKVVCHTVLRPKVKMAPNDVTNRKDGQIYTDMIDMEDKMFIFQFVTGGTRDLEQFREDFDESVGGLDDVEDVEDSPESEVSDQG